MKNKLKMKCAIICAVISILIAIMTTIHIIDYKLGSWMIVLPSIAYTILLPTLDKYDENKKSEDR